MRGGVLVAVLTLAPGFVPVLMRVPMRVRVAVSRAISMRVLVRMLVLVIVGMHATSGTPNSQGCSASQPARGERSAGAPCP
jgi:hypothetical protein